MRAAASVLMTWIAVSRIEVGDEVDVAVDVTDEDEEVAEGAGESSSDDEQTDSADKSVGISFSGSTAAGTSGKMTGDAIVRMPVIE